MVVVQLGQITGVQRTLVLSVLELVQGEVKDLLIAGVVRQQIQQGFLARLIRSMEGDLGGLDHLLAHLAQAFQRVVQNIVLVLPLHLPAQEIYHGRGGVHLPQQLDTHHAGFAGGGLVLHQLHQGLVVGDLRDTIQQRIGHGDFLLNITFHQGD